MKFWGDDEYPKERLCPKNYGLKLPTTPRIANPCQEHYDLGFIQKSMNRRPNLAFEGSRLWRLRFLFNVISANDQISRVKPADTGKT
jgi:hypothetical protein